MASSSIAHHRSSSRRLLGSRASLVLGLLAFALVMSACSVPGRGDDDDAGNDSTPVASPGSEPTRAAVMPIVTPTVVTGDVSTQSPGTTPESEIPATYVVQENDSLYAIALRFNVELDALISANGLSDPNDIQVGQELTIPKP